MTTKSKPDVKPTVHPRFLRQPEVLALVGVAWITILRWEQEGLFPKRRKIGKRVAAWVESEVQEWCANKAAQPGGEGA